MSATDIRTSQGRGLSARLSARLSDALARLRAAQHRRAVYLRTRDELWSLSDRELNDLDISRSDIVELAREAAAQA